MLGKLVNAVFDAIDASKGIPLSPGSITELGNHFELIDGAWVEMTDHRNHTTPANGAFCTGCGQAVSGQTIVPPYVGPLAPSTGATVKIDLSWLF